MILCDIGNTNFHFWINGKNITIGLDKRLPKLDELIYFISVNKKGTKRLKKHYKKTINLKKYITIKSSYKNLGIDRIVACMGIKNGVIVDAGSAITIDIIKHSKHKGGVILAGLNSYKKLYTNISKKLDFRYDFKRYNKLPNNTSDSINYGILNSIIEVIKKVSKNKQILFTGGDGKTLQTYFINNIYKKDLIFTNMLGVIRKRAI